VTVPTSSQGIGRISPTRLRRLLSCPLGVAFDQARRPGRRSGGSPAALVGTAIHRCIEALLRDRSQTLEGAWELTCQTMATEGNDPTQAPNSRRAFSRLRRRVPALLELVDDAEWTGEPLIEERLTSNDGIFEGKPDLVLVGQRRLLVVDYKSGFVSDDGAVEEDYSDQLLLYAHLSAEVHGIDSVDAFLLSLREGLVPVDVSEEQRGQYVQRAIDEVQAYDQRVPGLQPATPSEDVCHWCNHACACDHLWDEIGKGQVLEPWGGHALEGELLDSPTTARNNLSAARIRVERGTVAGDVTVSDIPQGSTGGMSEGSRVRIVGLRQIRDDSHGLAWVGHKSQYLAFP